MVWAAERFRNERFVQLAATISGSAAIKRRNCSAISPRYLSRCCFVNSEIMGDDSRMSTATIVSLISSTVLLIVPPIPLFDVRDSDNVVTECDKPFSQEYHLTPQAPLWPDGAQLSDSLLQLTKTYLSIEAALKTSLLSENTRRLLELAQVELDRDIARGMKVQIRKPARMPNAPNGQVPGSTA